MKKIIAAFDGLKYSNSTTSYSIQLAKQTNTHLVGVFLDDPFYTSYNVYELIVEKDVPQDKLKEYEAKDRLTRNKSVENFVAACQNSKVEYSVRKDKNIALQDLIHESIYADLLVIESKETFTHYKEKLPTRFIRDLLSDVQCPVIIAPQKYKPVEKVILLYDGEPSSVYAIKMFAYLLPELKDLETEILSVNPPNRNLHLPDTKLMKEFIKRHYPKINYTVLKGHAEMEIVKYLVQKPGNTLVVLGAYRRGIVSRWFRESMADVLLKEIKLPLFVAHNK